MSELFNYCSIVGKTDVGQKRAANEDSMGSAQTPNGLVAVVCDGMGGHVGGAVASKIAVETIIGELTEHYYQDPRIGIGKSIDKANQAIIQRAAAQPELSGMGSTCVLLIVRDGKVYIGHVGDSRIYLVRSRTIKRLTKDHSYVQTLVDQGILTEEEAERHPRKNEITNALGIPNMKPATVAEEAYLPEAGDCFILCSDGLCGMIPERTICNLASRQAEMSAQARVDEMVQKANENGGLDNITVQMVEFSVTPGVSVPGKRFSKSKLWIAVASIVALFAIAVGMYLAFIPGNQSGDGPVRDTDSISISCEDVKFEPGKKILEIEYSEECTLLKWGDRGSRILEGNCSYNSFNLESGNVEVQYNNSVLAFKEDNAGDVVFCLMSSDSTKVYRIAVSCSDKEEKSSDIAREIADNVNPTNIEARTIVISEALAKGAEITFDFKNGNLVYKDGKYPIAISGLTMRDIVSIKEKNYSSSLWDVKNTIRGKSDFSIVFVAKSDINANKYAFTFDCNGQGGKPYVVKVTLDIKPASQMLEFTFSGKLEKESVLQFSLPDVSLTDANQTVKVTETIAGVAQGYSVKTDCPEWLKESGNHNRFKLAKDLEKGDHDFVFELTSGAGGKVVVKIRISVSDAGEVIKGTQTA